MSELKKRWIFFPLFVLFGIAVSNQHASAANRLIYENFDDQQINSNIIVYGADWAVLRPPQYNLTSPGRGGTGYCFSSGTVAMANLSWEKNLPNPWPTDELYFSMWMRYPSFKSTDSNENFKFFYPHWNGTNSYVHYSASGPDTVYYSAKGNGKMLSDGNWLSCPGMMDGNWHHYEFYIKFSTCISKFWYDGVLKVNHDYANGSWTPNTMYYVWAPSIDAEETGTFSRQVDDWELWDGMPGSSGGSASDPVPPTTPAAPSDLKVVK